MNALIPGDFWWSTTRWGDAGTLLPVGLLIGLWLVVSARSLDLALRWLLPFLLAVTATLVSKIAFIGFGVGIASIDFTGFSGHAMLSAAVYPMAAYTVFARAPVRGRVMAVAAGYAVALVVMVSRWEVNAHSVSEAALGFALGALASGGALLWLRFEAKRGLPIVATCLLAAWLCVTPREPRILHSHSLVTRMALAISGRSKPYTRADLRRHRPAQPERMCPSAAPALPCTV